MTRGLEHYGNKTNVLFLLPPIIFHGGFPCLKGYAFIYLVHIHRISEFLFIQNTIQSIYHIVTLIKQDIIHRETKLTLIIHNMKLSSKVKLETHFCMPCSHMSSRSRSG